MYSFKPQKAYYTSSSISRRGRKLGGDTRRSTSHGRIGGGSILLEAEATQSIEVWIKIELSK